MVAARVVLHANRYHQPSDEILPEFAYEGATQYGSLALSVIVDLANSEAWPNWLAGQEFKAARDRMMSGR